MKFSKTLLSTIVLSSPLVDAIIPPPENVIEERTEKTLNSKDLQNDITSEGLMENLAALDTIARQNGNQRAFGFPGYAASVAYVESKLKASTTWKYSKQDFPGFFALVQNISVVIDGTSYYTIGLTYSPSTTPAGFSAPLVLGPSGAVGCSAAGYAGIDVKDKIVLVQRGACPDGTTFAGKMKAAKAAGAAATIIYHSIPVKLTAATLSAPNPDLFHPTFGINMADGEKIAARLNASESLTAYVQQTQLIETRITQNIIAESIQGDPKNVVMLGAHLDSVQAGPGINDDGSGSTLILELFEALQKYKFKNKIRLAWWGAEENGLVGSNYYVSKLGKIEISNLLAYLNFDMVSRGYYGVFDGDGSNTSPRGPPGSEVIEKLFVDDFVSKGYTVTPAVFSGGSDYKAFMEVLKKPVGGLHTGTGVTEDDCYHQDCDTYNNANSTLLTINAKAAAHVLSILAENGKELLRPTIVSTRDALKDTIMRRDPHTGNMVREAPFYPWPEMDGVNHGAGCSGGLH